MIEQNAESLERWVDSLAAGRNAREHGLRVVEQIRKLEEQQRVALRKIQIQEDKKLLSTGRIPLVFSQAAQILKKRWRDARSEVMVPSPDSTDPVGIRLRWNYRVSGYSNGMPTWQCSEVTTHIGDNNGERALFVNGNPEPLSIEAKELSSHLKTAIMEGPFTRENVPPPNIVRQAAITVGHAIFLVQNMKIKQ